MTTKKPRRIGKYAAYDIPAARIYVDSDFNCRGEFTMQSCQELANSIRDRGLDIPLIVQPAEDVEGGLPAGFDWRLIAGFRREKAMRVFLKLESYPCVIRRGLSEQEAHDLNFMENLERRDLTMFEEAMWIAKRYPKGVSLRQASRDLKRPSRWVHTRLRLLKLPKSVQKQAATGLLSDVNIEAICQLETEREQVSAAKKIVQARRKYGKNVPLAKFGLATRSFRYRRSKEEISKLIAKMLEAGITGLAPRVASWCAGYIEDSEIDEDIARQISLNQTVENGLYRYEQHDHQRRPDCVGQSGSGHLDPATPTR
jgi:ParB/RepB/Spo0J family partition protein